MGEEKINKFGINGMAPLVQVYDMPTTIQFYRDVLGFSVVDAAPPGDEPDWVWMRWHGIDLMFNTAYEKEYRPAVPDQQRMAAHEDTSIYFGCKQIDELYAYLLSKGIEVAPPSITGYHFKALYVKDPDQFLLVFHWPVGEK
jgi:glyoxylase I family protein